MKISIVTVCLDVAHTIRDTIESVLAQDYPHIEYIVVDGASRDATPAIVRSYGDRIARFVSEPDRGTYDSMNKALALATGDVIGFLHADDFFADKTVVSEIAAAFSAPDVDCVFGDIDIVAPQDVSRVVRRWRSGAHRPGSLLRGWYPPHPTVYLRRAVFAEVGGFDERYRIAADMDHMLRVFEVRGVRSRHLPRVMVKMRAGGMSNRSLRNIWRANVETWQSQRRHGFDVGPWMILAKLARKVPQLVVRD